MSKLVSVISPCYNGEKYIKRFIESVLMQKYNNIELIIVDDGSTDATKSIIDGYAEKFEARGYTLKYIYQENAGQAAAINQGLSVFSGDYMMWVDSDDILLPENISKKVEFLEENLECGFVLCEGIFVNSDDVDKKTGELKRVKPTDEDNLFYDLVYGKNVVFGPGTILVRRSALLKAIPSRHIYESREGQNWQLILPLAYNFKCGYIEEPLFKCVEHSDSHSRKKRGYKESLRRCTNFSELMISTVNAISEMPEDEKVVWRKRISVKYEKLKLNLAYGNKDAKTVRECKAYLVENGQRLQFNERNRVFWLISAMVKKLKKDFFGYKLSNL